MIDPTAFAPHLPLLVAAGWLVSLPPFSREEGHEVITREAWASLALTDEQREALMRGVRAPDVSPLGFLVSVLPHAQRRHALRALSATTTAQAVQEMRSFLVLRHVQATTLPEGRRRWAAFGEILHCIQDSYSPAHADRDGPRITRMKHWGPLDLLRRRGAAADEHGFPTDARDRAQTADTLTEEARQAAAASRRYLELVLQQGTIEGDPDQHGREFGEFLETCVVDGSTPRGAV